jgi:hypothetical protein
MHGDRPQEVAKRDPAQGENLVVTEAAGQNLLAAMVAAALLPTTEPLSTTTVSYDAGVRGALRPPGEAIPCP